MGCSIGRSCEDGRRLELAAVRPEDAAEDPIHSLLVLAFWTGLVVPILVYLVYPALVGLVARLRPVRSLDLAGPWPSVAVTIAAHDEELDIARAVRSVLAQDYPGPPITVLVGLDGCTDDTRAVLDGLAEPSVSYLDLLRGGKAATDNELVAAAAGDELVTTAAGSIFAEGSLRRLVEPFRDQRVGCTTGIFAPRQDGSTAAGGEGLYWRLESGLLGCCCTTAVSCTRRTWSPLFLAAGVLTLGTI